MARVDILVPTIGRSSLEVAIASAVRQTYRNGRVVIVGDGPQPDARSVARWVQRRWGAVEYRETPERFGHGDGVKHWWLAQDECSEWVKFLDDDDTLHPACVATMMAAAGARVSVVLCEMLMVFTARNGCAARMRIVPGEMQPGAVGTGSMLVQRDRARGIAWPRQPDGDFLFLRELANRGIVERVQFPLYNYHGYRDNNARGY
ncbi:MAG: glycosyltransferase family 2 protein [Kiritimatiellae bacterium]|nr:glycosyltransferase family 2 protein [Kiritimatiellia bacterium]